MGIKHAFTSAKSDGADSTLVQPSNWNADHEIDETLTASSGTEDVVTATITVNQSGTAGYRGLFIDVTESATGSGDTKPLAIDVGGSEVFSVDSAGVVSLQAGTSSAPTLVSASDSQLGITFQGGEIGLADGGFTRFTVSSSKIQCNANTHPKNNGTNTLGTGTSAWKQYHGASISAPSSPTNGFVMWLDSSSGNIEFKDSGGLTGSVALS